MDLRYHICKCYRAEGVKQKTEVGTSLDYKANMISDSSA